MAEGYSSDTNFRENESPRGQSNSGPENDNGNSRQQTDDRSTLLVERNPRMRSNVSGDNRQRQHCRFYKRGLCIYGHRCKFMHVVNNLPGNLLRLSHPVASATPSTAANEQSTETIRSANSDWHARWAEAPEFVPCTDKSNIAEVLEIKKNEDLKLCLYAEKRGVCNFPDGECTYLHGDICNFCGNAALHPHNAEKRKLHTQECSKQHEKNMKLSLAMLQSKEKICSVCFEVIMEKPTRERRFGILSGCNHCFCLSCIRRWREAPGFQNRIIRSCPECRIISEFVCPTKYWIDNIDEKGRLIKDYKYAIIQKQQDKILNVSPQTRQPRGLDQNNEIDVIQQMILWDFVDVRENRWLHSITDNLENLVSFNFN